MECRKLKLLALSMLLFMMAVLPVYAETDQKVCILFTHDMHSHLSPSSTENGTIGGFARLKTLIDHMRQQEETVFLLDAGDFSMGTLYQTIFESHAAELTLMAQLGFDATTLGNHEFDYRGLGLGKMLQTAAKNAAEEGLILPTMLCSNIDWSSIQTDDGRAFQTGMESYGVKDHIILERNGIKTGIFGLMGPDSQSNAPLAPVRFTEMIEAAKAQVKALRAEGAELIVCLSHSGVWEKAEDSEDELLAKAVPEIDVIISGHTHTTLSDPIQHGETLVVSCGEYTQHFGKLVLERNGERWKTADYELIPTDDSVASDPLIEAKITEYKEAVSSEFLSQYGYTFEQVLCQNPGNLASEREMLADALRYAVEQAEAENYESIAMTIVPSGVIRGTLPAGEVTVSDAFDILSLGIGPDRIPGYPLVSVYLTGRELYDLAEVDASVSQLMGGTDLTPSGGGWEYRTNRLILSRVSDVWLFDDQGNQIALEEDKLYRVVADLYSGQMLGAVKSSSFGLLSLEPKDRDGNVIADFEAHIIRGPEGGEVKAWGALADYLHSFGGTDGAGVIPARYTKPSGRIVASEAANISEFFSHAGRIWYVIGAAALVLGLVLLSLILVARAVVCALQRKRRK